MSSEQVIFVLIIPGQVMDIKYPIWVKAFIQVSKKYTLFLKCMAALLQTRYLSEVYADNFSRILSRDQEVSRL